MNRDEALKLAAIAKLFSNLAKTADNRAKAILDGHLGPGDRTAARDGRTEYATISRAKISEKDTLTIDDEEALIAWLERNQDGDGIIRRVADWKRADLEASVLNGGELPDGTNIITRTTGGGISVRQSEKQATNLIQTPALMTRLLTATQEESDQK